MWLGGAFLAGMAAIATLHTVFVVPSVLQAAQEQVEKRIELHERGTHPGGVTRAEFSLLLARLDKLATTDALEGLRRELLAELKKQDR